ncbi:hypothetical protein ANN_00228 [Periplaneta americana]|uniref:PiggyBac transposable element-derived protein domain-containing protein n=1 Tax=Periplaneta americana TaxID=6978 RepID=A0ABQ8TS12_PERAM|nr:hypothetical protein ANN_00228 [Periplaneta americana]
MIKGFVPPRSQVFIDNYVNSIPLLENMTRKEINVTGTIRADRTQKAPLKDLKKSARGSFHSIRDPASNITLVRWNDNSQVTMATNRTDSLVTGLTKCSRYSASSKNRVNMPQPSLVNEYNTDFRLLSKPGCSTGTTHCRHCSEYETLPHMLGSCPQGEVLRIKRHSIICSMMADALRSKNLDVHEEVHCIADGGSNRRIDIIAINRNKQTAEIIDPTIRFEISATQPSEMNEEKKKIYEPMIQYLSAKYNIEKNHSYQSLLRSERNHSKSLCKVEGKIQADKRSSRCHRHHHNKIFCSDISTASLWSVIPLCGLGASPAHSHGVSTYA